MDGSVGSYILYCLLAAAVGVTPVTMVAIYLE